MIIDGRLAGWIGDAAARARTLERGADVGRGFKTLPPLVRLGREAEAAKAEGAAALLDVARTFITDDSAIAACLDPLIGAANDDPFFRPPLRTGASEVHCGILLFDRPYLSVFLSVASVAAIAAKKTFRTGAASISFPGTQSLFRYLKGGGATLSIWEAPPIEPAFSTAGSGTCKRAERRLLADGDLLELDGRRRTYVVDHAVSDLVYLQATTPLDAAPLTVEYDSVSHEFVGASSTDEASSRIQMMLALLRDMDRRDAAPLFEAMLHSEHFYLRWAAMREFLALDADLARPHLRAMAEGDVHPEVREAAFHTLTLLFPGDAAAPTEDTLCPA